MYTHLCFTTKLKNWWCQLLAVLILSLINLPLPHSDLELRTFSCLKKFLDSRIRFPSVTSLPKLCLCVDTVFPSYLPSLWISLWWVTSCLCIGYLLSHILCALVCSFILQCTLRPGLPSFQPPTSPSIPQEDFALVWELVSHSLSPNLAWVCSILHSLYSLSLYSLCTRL